MSKYVILTESGADVPKDLAKRYGIYVIPMHVSFDTETKDDGFFPATEVFEYYKTTKKLPKTAATNAHEFGEMFDKIHAEHPESHIIYLAYSSVTTSTYASAVLAMMDRDYVTAIDTKHVSAGEAFVVVKTAQYLEENEDATIEEITNYVVDVRARTHMGFFPGDLIYLKEGGRVSNAAYMGAKILSLNPLIEINDGYLVATKKYRGKMAKVAPKLTKEFTETYHFDRKMLYLVFSAGLAKSIMDEVEGIAKELGFEEVRWVSTGCVISTHSGPGAFGIIGMERSE